MTDPTTPSPSPAKEAGGQWLDIESAPKGRDDLIDVWCIDPDGESDLETRLTDVFWHVADEIIPQTGWARITDDGEVDFVESEPRGQCGLPPWKPTHWMPLPAPPANK
jgi:hypothetical protein